jgi:tetratricopeptide (TPR) repeat protein
LRAFALVDREAIPDEREPQTATDTIRLHRLVREVAARRCGGDAREEALRALVEVLAAVYPRRVYDDPETWPRARRLDALALALVDGHAAPSEAAAGPVSALLNSLASYRHGALATYTAAKSLFGRALAIREKACGPEHPDTTTSLNNLAVLLQHQGDLAGARPLYERALAIREKALGPEHPKTALSLNNLAWLLRAQGDWTGARPLYERALAIREKALGPEHPNANRVRDNVARLLLATGDARQAVLLGHLALAAHEKILGPAHPWTQDSARVVADALGDTEEAAALRERYGLADAGARG